jgi:hypothetical protein
MRTNDQINPPSETGGHQMTRGGSTKPVLALIAAGGFAMFAWALPAAAQSESMTIAGNGQLIAKGAAVNLTVDVVCIAGDSTSVAVNLTEGSHHVVAGAGGEGFVASCTGSDQLVPVTLTATAGSPTLSPGTAFASLTGSECPADPTQNCFFTGPFNGQVKLKA